MELWLVADRDKELTVHDSFPYRDINIKTWESNGNCCEVTKDETKNIIGYVPSWEDEPIKVNIDSFHPNTKTHSMGLVW